MDKTLYSQKSAILVQHLRALRERAGMTQRDLAEAVGRDHGMIAKLELGQRRLDVVEYYQLVRAMGSDPEKEAAILMRALAGDSQITLD